MLLTIPIVSGCKKSEVIKQVVVKTVENQAETEERIATLGEGVLEGNNEKIKGVILKARGKSLALKKDAVKIKEKLAESWWKGMFSGLVTFFTEEGGLGILAEAGKNILTQNWGGLVMGAVAGGVEYMRRKEKKKKQEFACAINEIAHEPDEKVRHEKLRKTFNNRRKSDGKV
jgi:hypothetical protein